MLIKIDHDTYIEVATDINLKKENIYENDHLLAFVCSG
jgi:hypothetical protein